MPLSPKGAAMKLTPKQERFVAEYLVDLNATQAAIRAGYSAKTAKAQGSRMLTNVDVASAIAAGQRARGERIEATADDVLREITRLAMFDPADLITVKRPADIARLPENVRRAIVGWNWDKKGRFVVKTAKEGALEMMGRHHGLFKYRIEHSGKVTQAVELSDEQLAAIAAGGGR